MAFDNYGRRIHYLRISLTDHCNLRCIYCMPEEMSFQPSAELLQDGEVIRLVQIFARLGFDKIRLTGGEPTLRANLVDIVRQIAQTPGIRVLSMTTNGILFSRLAGRLAEAGLQRVNFSLDTLNPDKFKMLTRWGSIDHVWEGIQAAEKARLVPIKINSVVMREQNIDDVVDLARLTIDHPWHVRFIEMMPFAGTKDIQQQQGVSASEIQERIEKSLGILEVLHEGKLVGEARLFRLPQSKGHIGFISTVTNPFCASCSRIRLTADGTLRLCLLREREVDLLTPLRADANDEEMRQIIVEGIWGKPWGHQLARGEVPENRTMSQIGG